LNNALAGDPRRSGYLLAAGPRRCPAGAVVLAVVDPGVGGKRLPMVVEAGGRVIRQARTFGDVQAGEAFWYCDSIGLVELAVNQGRADSQLGLSVGSPVRCL
jgi:S-adenosylmethionine hydrolase